MHYAAPEFGKEVFNCPHCGAYARMYWRQLAASGIGHTLVHMSSCPDGHNTYWISPDKIDGMMLYPSGTSAPMPSPDLPEVCEKDYMEARDIVDRSPRGTAALLRLVIQKLCKHLGLPGKKIDDDIKVLVRDKNLSEMVQQSLDAIRVIGNNAVHPGELSLEDDQETALTLFELINIIVDEMITKPNKAKALYDRLPQGAKDAIAKRDAAKA